MEYMIRSLTNWDKFIKLGVILDETHNLTKLNQEMENGDYDMFDAKTMKQLVSSLYQNSQRRAKTIELAEQLLI